LVGGLPGDVAPPERHVYRRKDSSPRGLQLKLKCRLKIAKIRRVCAFRRNTTVWTQEGCL